LGYIENEAYSGVNGGFLVANAEVEFHYSEPEITDFRDVVLSPRIGYMFFLSNDLEEDFNAYIGPSIGATFLISDTAEYAETNTETGLIYGIKAGVIINPIQIFGGVGYDSVFETEYFSVGFGLNIFDS
jgi:hypothetical protein